MRRTFRAPFAPRGGEREVDALAGVDLTIEAGELVAIVGPSGCGKSTLLRIIAGLDVADAGSVHVAAGAGAGAIGYVFQDAHLLPWRTVRGNVALPLELGRIPEGESRNSVDEALRAVELLDAEHAYPAALSGGMRMRASIARALVTRPRLLLMDEPFAALDELTRHRLHERLRRIWAEQQLTVVFVTHAIFEAAYLAERAVVLTRRPGRVTYDAPIDLPADRPANVRGTADFARAAARLLEALEAGSA